MLRYACSQCGRMFPIYHLACPECGGWESLVRARLEITAGDTLPVELASLSSVEPTRIKTRVKRLDKLLGGGFMPGSSVLLVGEPGAGKSTLIMQLLRRMDLTSLYVTGEEALSQLKLRAERLRINSRRILLLFETNVNKIAAHIRGCKPGVVVVDSVQTIYTDNSGTVPGSSTQIRKCTYLLRRLAQEEGFLLIVVGQVTKDMKAAGPKLLEHAVDVVLALGAGEESRNERTLLASKNRFGSTLAGCSLAMRKNGLQFDSGKTDD